jgi:hypothetical protein
MSLKKTEYVISLLNGAQAQADNRAASNELRESFKPLRERMEAKIVLGEDPTASKAPEVIASMRAAVATHNAKVQVTLPDDATILAGLESAESDTPTDL